MKPARNDLCPCGSGKKHKKCCLKKDEAARSAELAAAAAATAAAAAAAEETEKLQASPKTGADARPAARSQRRRPEQTGAGQSLFRRRAGTA